MQSMFGGGHQGQFGGASFNQSAMNPMGQGVQPSQPVQVGQAGEGQVQFSAGLGSKSKDRNGRRAPYAVPQNWPWSAK